MFTLTPRALVTPQPDEGGDFAVRVRTSRRARCIRIDVRPSGEVVLTIPRGNSRAEAHAFLHQRRRWVARTRARLLAAEARQSSQTFSGDGSDNLPIRGHPVRIEPVAAPVRKAVARFEAGRIALQVPAARLTDTPFLHRLLLTALRAEAQREARRLLDEESARLGLAYRAVAIRDQKSRWGSCGPDGSISLNWRLLMAPPEVFRYVAIHELCHLRWRSHGPRFWGLVARQMPDFEFHRAWLRRHGDELQAWPPRLSVVHRFE